MMDSRMTPPDATPPNSKHPSFIPFLLDPFHPDPLVSSRGMGGLVASLPGPLPAPLPPLGNPRQENNPSRLTITLVKLLSTI